MRVTAYFQDVTRVEADIFIASIFSDVRPPRGLAGKIDWYLGGFISRLLLEEKLRGEMGENTLVAIQHKLLTSRLLLVGMGVSNQLLPETVAAQFRRVAGIIRNLRLQRIAIEIPLLAKSTNTTIQILESMVTEFRGAFCGSPDEEMEIHILSRTEEESEYWRWIIREALSEDAALRAEN